MRKKITVKGIVIVLLFSVFVLSIIKQSIAIKRISNDMTIKSQELDDIKEKNKKLQAELERAQSNYDYLERLARERLGLIKDGEEIISPLKPQE